MKNDVSLSVIMPFYKRVKELRYSLFLNALHLRPDLEVILALDEPSESDSVIALLGEFPSIKWLVLVNRQDHEWRNPAPAINVGLRNAVGRYVLICSPESVFCGNVPKQFLDLIEDSSFLCGHVKFLAYGEKLTTAAPSKPFGSLFVSREAISGIGGYDESFSLWGGEDDEIRHRLQLSGLKKVECEQIVLAHYEAKEERHKRERHKHDKGALDRLARASVAKSPVLENSQWGRNFSEVLRSWRHAGTL